VIDDRTIHTELAMLKILSIKFIRKELLYKINKETTGNARRLLQYCQLPGKIPEGYL
jgi:hypothetical protein